VSSEAPAVAGGKLEDETEETPAVSAARAIAHIAAALAEPRDSEPRLETDHLPRAHAALIPSFPSHVGDRPS